MCKKQVDKHYGYYYRVLGENMRRISDKSKANEVMNKIFYDHGCDKSITNAVGRDVELPIFRSDAHS